MEELEFEYDIELLEQEFFVSEEYVKYTPNDKVFDVVEYCNVFGGEV